MYLLVKILIYNLSLAISLGVKCGKELNFKPKNTIEFVPEIRYKLGAMIRDS